MDPAGRICGAALLAALGIGFAQGGARAPRLLSLEGDLEGVHDPAIIKQGDTYYLFSTGGSPGSGLIPIRCSKDLRRWALCGHVFDKLPEWATREIPGARVPWAPDISYFRGKYRLYYAVSTFGKNESAIGLASNQTLDPKSPSYRWVDEGLVVRSHQQDDWNAIDPNLVIQDNQHLWLNWGSFWSGIKMRRVDPETGKLSSRDTTLYSLASRPRTPEIGGSIEAPFIIRHGRYWYLFASFDFCCRGTKSTYNVVVGRSRRIPGPYLDQTGKAMTEGGGTPVIQATTPNWRGPGHEAVLQDPRGDYLVFHAYQGGTGKPYLQISTTVWEKGWPRVGALP
ncbi:MAG: arabinan endo-1,5-alpha-L-arabinosidase [Bryobacteraceae bacterium]|jgi:arabinan endo-1,5-alpha-L-arabinosidase